MPPSPSRPKLYLLGGGAAQGLVARLQEQFERSSGCTIQATFGAVGLMKDRLLAGAPCDVLILTQALTAQLEASGHLVAHSGCALGRVKTGIAVKDGAPWPAVDSPTALKAALLAAQGIYFPDPQKATAGIHFMGVLKRMGIADELAQRLHVFANGAMAMAALAQAPGERLIGCTQVTEILYTPGVRLVAPLPSAFELATVYTAALCASAQQARQAAELIALLGSNGVAALRQQAGFEPTSPSQGAAGVQAGAVTLPTRI